MEGIGGKGWSAEGNAPEKVATRPLPLRCACGPLPLMMPRVAHFSGASPSADLQIQHSPSLGVPANGPQTTETGENVAWGAGRWTSNAGNGRKRQQRRGRMFKRGQKKKLGIELLLSYLEIFLLLLLETEVLDVDCLLFGNTLLH